MQYSLNALPVISSFFLLFVLYGVGARNPLRGQQSNLAFHLQIALGFGIFFILFNILSIFLASYVLYVTLWLILVLLAAINYKQIVKNVKALRFTLSIEYVFFVVVFIPHIFRTLSPPTSADGLSFYLPNIEWIYYNGLTFNPYLTAYTTMPLGAEELFSMVYPFGGYYAIRIVDALFCFMLIDLLYNFIRGFVGKNVFKSALILLLLAPGTFFFVFGTGKVDVINIYFMSLGFALLVKYWNTKYLPLVIFVFSLSLSIKYTSWLVLGLPLLLLCAAYIYQNIQRNFWIVFVPLAFVMPTLIKNQVQVNNPMASIFPSPKQTQFVSLDKGGLPKHPSLESIIVVENPLERFIAFTDLIKGLIIPILYTFVFFVVALQFFKKIYIHQLWLWLLFLISSYGLWVYFLGISPQPLRFVWLLIIICIMLIARAVELLLVNYFSRYTILFSSALFTMLSIAILYKIIVVHGHQVPAFFKVNKMELSEWYIQQNQDHYGFSVAFKNANFHHRDVAYLSHVAHGIFDVRDYGNLPTDEEYYQIKQDYQKEIATHRYLLCTDWQRAALGINKYAIVLQKGNYFVLDKQTLANSN